MGRDRSPSITILPGGPLAVSGRVPLRWAAPVRNDRGEPVDWRFGPELETGDDTEYHLCRCGGSARRPFCDGACERTGFVGTEEAARRPDAARRAVLEGDGITVTDDLSLCAVAGFCTAEGANVWELLEEGEDPEVRERLIRAVHRCPSGRLEVATTPEDAPIEPALERAIAVTVDGPLWAMGRIPVRSADGSTLAPRNRVTLCRCGSSGNRPFCDGSHVRVGFRDEAVPSRPPGPFDEGDDWATR